MGFFDRFKKDKLGKEGKQDNSTSMPEQTQDRYNFEHRNHLNGITQIDIIDNQPENIFQPYDATRIIIDTNSRENFNDGREQHTLYNCVIGWYRTSGITIDMSEENNYGSKSIPPTDYVKCVVGINDLSKLNDPKYLEVLCKLAEQSRVRDLHNQGLQEKPTGKYPDGVR